MAGGRILLRISDTPDRSDLLRFTPISNWPRHDPAGELAEPEPPLQGDGDDRAIGEITGRPRRVSPTLEMVGLLGVTYDGIDDLAANPEFFSGMPALGALATERRRDILQVFLDVIRRAGALDSDALTNGGDFGTRVLI